jgi:hypothetical protein
VRDQAIQRPLELADVRELVARQLLDHTGGDAHVALAALGAQYGNARLVVGCPDVDDQATG